MVTLDDYKLHIKPAVDFIIDEFEALFSEDKLFLSALGARICYSADHPLKLIREDERVNDVTERKKFLLRLYKSKHFSVFAHSPVVCRSKFPSEMVRLFKAWTIFGPFSCLLLNARHIAEALDLMSDEYFTAFLEKEVAFSPFEETNGFGNLGGFFWCSLEEVYQKKFDIINLQETGFKEEFEQPCILCFYYPCEPWYWFSFIFHGVSRIMTHQFVRHTWFNFSQRSHRYTMIDNVVLPPSIKRDRRLKEMFEIDVAYIMSSYESNIELDNVPKEDARFIAPMGSATTIMASAPLFVWQDFIQKRNHPRAQWEIRACAKVVEKMIEHALKQNTEEVVK